MDANKPYTFQEKSQKIYDTLKPCNQSFVLENFYDNNKDFGIEQLHNVWTFQCYDFSQFKFGLHDSGGGAGSILVSPLSIWTFKCGKTTRGIKAKPCPKYFNGSLSRNDAVVEVWTNELLFNPDNLTHPFEKSFTRVGSTGLSKNSESQVYINMKVNENHDNKGFLLDTNIITRDVGVDSFELNVIPLDIPKNFYDFSIYIGFTKIYYKYQRTYMKLQDLLAQVGGVISALYTAFQIISYFFNSYVLDMYLLSLINKEEVRENKQDKIMKIEEKNSTSKPPSKLNLTKSKMDNSKSKLEDLTFDKIKKESINKLNINNYIAKNSKIFQTQFTMYEYLKYMLYCGSNNIKSSLEYVDNIISIENLLQHQSEFNHFKNIFLNDFQSKAFKLLKNIIDYDSKDFNHKTQNEIKEYFKLKKATSSCDDYDKYLMSNIIIQLE